MALNRQDGAAGSYVETNDGPALMQAVQVGGATYQLLQDADADGEPVENIVAGNYLFGVAGTFGGATVSLQYLGPDGETYIDLPDTELTAAGALEVRIGANATVKAVVTGGAPSGLYSNLT